jgi:hypothetical protein
MKKLLFVLILFLCFVSFAQTPQGMNYQATIRNNTGQLLMNQIVSMKFKIIQNSISGTIVYNENHTITTDDLGHVNLVIGQGTPTLGLFSSINWSTGLYFLGIELNTGTGFLDLGTTQLLSVPYALYSADSGSRKKSNTMIYLSDNF